MLSQSFADRTSNMVFSIISGRSMYRHATALLLACALAGLPAAAQTIDTRPGGISSNTTLNSGTLSYGLGQTFTVPSAGGSTLNSFSFFFRDQFNRDPIAITFRAYLMAWDPAANRPTGDFLYRSAEFPGSAAPFGGAFEEFAFKTGGLALSPGQMYVAFVNGTGATSGQDDLEFIYPSQYAGGSMFEVQPRSQSPGVESTAQDFRDGNSYNNLSADLAFTASFSSVQVTSTPEPASLTLLGIGLVCVGGAAAHCRRKQARKSSMRRIHPLAAVALLTFAAAPLLTPAAAQTWGQQGVTIFEAPSGFSQGFIGVNNSGQVAGNVSNYAALFTPGTGPTLLGTLGGSYGYGLGVNNAGLVAGYANAPGSNTSHAFVTTAGGAMQDLGTLGGSYSAAYGVSSSGQVVGYAYTAGNAAQHAFITAAGGIMQDLGTLGGSNSVALGINDAGQVAGYSSIAGGALHAFMYSGGVMQDLGTLGGSESIGYQVGRSGQVVGWSYTAGDAVTDAFVASGGVMQGLGSPFGGNFSVAYQISDGGAIVGRADDASGRPQAALWEANGSGYTGYLFDSIINQGANSGWVMQEARGISQDGRFVDGYATNSALGYSGWVVLEENVITATPEPASLMLVGTGLLGLAVARRKRCN